MASNLQKINALKKDASFLTKKLWKSSLKSIQVIAVGNAADETRFTKLEEMQLEKPNMLPVNRDDELRSRANYYYNSAREQIEQESDIFESVELSPIAEYTSDGDEESSPSLFTKDQIQRYFYFLRRGEEQRQYILRKYKFEDPCPTSFDSSRVDALEYDMLGTFNAEIIDQAIDDGQADEHVNEALQRIFSEDDNEDDWA